MIKFFLKILALFMSVPTGILLVAYIANPKLKIFIATEPAVFWGTTIAFYLLAAAIAYLIARASADPPPVKNPECLKCAEWRKVNRGGLDTYERK